MNQYPSTRSIIRLILITSLISFFGLILFLARYSHPFADDLILMTAVREHGLTGYDKLIYYGWSGRFLSTFLGRISAYNNFLETHYWVHTFCLVLLHLISSITLFWALNRHVIRFTTKPLLIILCAGCYAATQISSLPQLSTAFYWFSSAVSYQSSIILIHFELVLLILFYNSNKPVARLIIGMLTAVIVVLINFNNELSILINAMILLAVFSFVSKRKHVPFMLVVAGVFAVSMYLTVSAPGNTIRSQRIPRANFPEAFGYALFRASHALWYIFKNPLFLVAFPAAFFSGSYFRNRVNSGSLIVEKNVSGRQISEGQFSGANITHEKAAKTIDGNKVAKYFIRNRHMVWPAIIVAMIFILLPVMHVSNGSFPARANNELVQYFVMVGLVAAFFTGTFYKINVNSKALTNTFTIAIAITLICNSFFGDLLQSVVSGRLHHQLLSHREKILHNAVKMKIRSVTLLSYDKHRDSLLATTFKNDKAQVKSITKIKPVALYLGDDLDNVNTIYHVKKFYGLQEIIVVR